LTQLTEIRRNRSEYV